MAGITSAKRVSTLNHEIRDLLTLFQYDKRPINIVGSASLNVMKYWSDIDFLLIFPRILMQTISKYFYVICYTISISTTIINILLN
jgi:hypothetical protein